MHPARPWAPLRLRLALALASLPLLAACGDDGDDDSAGETGAAETTETGAAETGAAETGAGDDSTVPPPECEALTCGEGELCVVFGDCTPDPPACVDGSMIPCDFGTGQCTLLDVCSGSPRPGALVCETCL